MSEISETVEGWGLVEAINALKADLAEANAAPETAAKFPITGVTVEMKVVATRNKGGKVGFKVPFIQTGLEGEVRLGNEATTTITLQLGTPVDASGTPISVRHNSDTLIR